MAPLLKEQPYIFSVQLHFGQQCTYDLNHWRYQPAAVYDPFATLAERQLAQFGLGKDCLSRPWITGVTPKRLTPVVVNRTHRYHNPHFPWRQVLQKYNGWVTFIGTHQEYIDFEKQFGKGVCLCFYECDDLLEAAQVIAGSELFIGNQSCCYAIAEGMKHRTIQETDPRCPDCIYERDNAQYALVGSELILPDL